MISDDVIERSRDGGGEFQRIEDDNIQQLISENEEDIESQNR